jgi:hypothetical protein
MSSVTSTDFSFTLAGLWNQFALNLCEDLLRAKWHWGRFFPSFVYFTLFSTSYSSGGVR